MTKNRKDRLVQGRRGDILERIKTYSNYTRRMTLCLLIIIVGMK